MEEEFGGDELQNRIPEEFEAFIALRNMDDILIQNRSVNEREAVVGDIFVGNFERRYERSYFLFKCLARYGDNLFGHIRKIKNYTKNLGLRGSILIVSRIVVLSSLRALRTPFTMVRAVSSEKALESSIPSLILTFSGIVSMVR